ncbi:MAG: GNAT family N-acetyltransferase [Nocardioidaceae bacterium]|nr:GNAT family N-acetyltransferase [Nocardioidaceae bacterium]
MTQAGAAPVLRSISPQDVAAVLELNALNVRALSPMDEDRLIRLLGWADRGDVLDVEGEVAGFVLTFAPGTAYDSANYRAFGERFGDDFYYLDRIVIGDRFRRRGLASAAYDELESVAAPYRRLTLEVNTVPPNEVSMAFHVQRGYVEVARLGGGDGNEVALLSKELR